MAEDLVAADLKALYEIATLNLTDIAYQFSEAATKVDSSRDAESNCFISPGDGGAGTSAAYDTWSTLRDYCQQILADTCNNTLATAEAVLGIMNDYAEDDRENSDGLAAAGLDDRIDQLDDGLKPWDTEVDPDDPYPSPGATQPDEIDAPPEPDDNPFPEPKDERKTDDD